MLLRSNAGGAARASFGALLALGLDALRTFAEMRVVALEHAADVARWLGIDVGLPDGVKQALRTLIENVQIRYG